MFCAIGSEAALALFAASLMPGVEAPGSAATAEGAGDVAVAVAGGGAASLAAEFVVEGVLADDPSSAPQPFNAIVASASKVALAMSLVFLMSASGSVKADAVSNPFKK
ncbi:hypothetical protein [Paraburkholderia sp.]|uniref:hypothetical protein n=1 Tax=Paraburkholderia sp. TaxID=1926495 RepID=UPI0039E4247D